MQRMNESTSPFLPPHISIALNFPVSLTLSSHPVSQLLFSTAPSLAASTVMRSCSMELLCVELNLQLNSPG